MSEKFVEKPNLPEAEVSHVIMSDYKPNFKDKLKEMGIKVTVPDKIGTINGSESYHADMSICHIGNDTVYVEKILNEEINCICIDEKVTSKRPLLNICIFGNNVICNTKKIYKPLFDILQKNGMNILHTNQSYAKCSSAIVGENAIITADESIYNLCIYNNIDVLKISVGDIELDGYKYGFIGGCCGFISKNELAFSGDIKLHKDYENIKSFARNYNVNLVSLSNDKLYDIGGILPIKEYL